MYYLIFIILGLLVFSIVVLYKVNSKFINLSKENKILKEKINELNAKVTNTVNEIPITNFILPDNDVLEENETQVPLMPVEIERFKLEIDPQIKNKLQHYYIVKELKKDKTSKAIFSNNEFEFANQNLYTSKVEARLFYDNKIANLSNNDANSVLEYELYIVNNVFFDAEKIASASDISTDEIKSYLLIDSAGKEQTDGRNFESFALRSASEKMNKKHKSQSTYISTKNSFLDGDYKD